MKHLLMDPYKVMVFFGIIACLSTQYFNFGQHGYPLKRRLQVLVLTSIGIIIGAICSVFGFWQNSGVLKLPPNEWLEHIGLTAYHGMIGAWLSFCIGSRILGMEVSKASSIAAPCIVIFFAFGRIGCSFAGCCYGRGVHLNFMGHEFYNIPTAQIEAIFLLSLYIALQLFIKKYRTIITILSYSIFRFFNEYLRGDNRGSLIPGIPFSTAQIISLTLFIIMMVALAYSGIKKRHIRKRSSIAVNSYSE